MEKLAVFALIYIFLIFSSSITHAQGNLPLWQYPNFYDQYNQSWGFQSYTTGHFSSFNLIAQYGKPWGFQKDHSIAMMNLFSVMIIPKNPYASDALWNLNWDLKDTDITLGMPEDGESINVDIGETIGFILPNYRDNYDADVEWVLDEDELDENIVEKIGDKRFPGYWYNNGGLMPAFKDGVEQWIFKAVGLDTATIRLDCINREDNNTGTIEIEVRVTDYSKQL